MTIQFPQEPNSQTAIIIIRYKLTAAVFHEIE